MTEEEISIYNLLLDRSEEACIVSIELYNKPTIKYRIEGFVFFICNAWELMLKAQLIKTKGEASIHYPDQPTRTINLENCVKILLTNENDPVRKNLERIIQLRNSCTHLIIPEYEQLMVGIFQSCLNNFVDKMRVFHSRNIEDKISSSFLLLAINYAPVTEDQIQSKYGKAVLSRFMSFSKAIEQESSSMNANNKYAIVIEHRLFITKKSSESTEKVSLVPKEEADSHVVIVTKLKDPRQSHPYTTKRLIEEINNNLIQKGLTTVKFNQANLNDINKVFQLKKDESYCYVNIQGKAIYYNYSPHALTFILDELFSQGIDSKSVQEAMLSIRGKAKKS